MRRIKTPTVTMNISVSAQTEVLPLDQSKKLLASILKPGKQRAAKEGLRLKLRPKEYPTTISETQIFQ